MCVRVGVSELCPISICVCVCYALCDVCIIILCLQYMCVGKHVLDMCVVNGRCICVSVCMSCCLCM